MKTPKVALVTGAGSGIGRATALEFAKRGYRIGLLGRTPGDLEALIEPIRRLGGEAVSLPADISVGDELGAVIDRLAQHFGRLDIVVANAGINGTWAPIESLTPEEWDKTIAINLRGTYLTLHHAVPHLKAAGGGAVVIVSSINGTLTFTSPGATAYAATKAAQVAMTRQLALELARHHIRINVVCPGAIETNIDEDTIVRDREDTAIPVVWPDGEVPITGGAPGRAEDVAHLIAFLTGDTAAHITGTPVWIDGGQGLLR